jgi:hypothetical protein
MARGITSFIGALVAAAVLASGGCGGPYKGKPQKPPKVKANPKGEEAFLASLGGGAAPTEIKYDDECNAKFSEDPSKAKKSPSKASPYNAQASDFLDRANSSEDPQVQISSIIGAIEQYKKALLEDNYNAEATYGLAVAYAKVRKKGCTLKLLKRLGELGANPKLAGGQARLDSFLNQVEDETAFKPFKNDAMSAIGR